MHILWLSWKDHAHPQAGGAEVVKAELCKRLAADGHEVIVFTARYDDSPAKSTHQGYKIVRDGDRFDVYWAARKYYKKHLKAWPDLVIDEMNTIPFFAKFYAKQKNILFVHQLARQIWFYQMFLPIGFIGYLLEPLYLRLLSDRKVITVSQSTKKDLMRHGFKAKNIKIISEGLEIEPVKSLHDVKKYARPTLLSHSAIRPMKRTLDQIRAFEKAKKKIPDLQLKISGDATGKYGERILRYIALSPYATDIEYCGRTTQAKKVELMQHCHYIISTAIKEGWGLTITEANSQGTPAIVYDSDGLRDSVQNNKTGYICKHRTVRGLAAKIEEAFADTVSYQTIRKNAWQWSKTMTFDKAYEQLRKAAKI